MTDTELLIQALQIVAAGLKDLNKSLEEGIEKI